MNMRLLLPFLLTGLFCAGQGRAGELPDVPVPPAQQNEGQDSARPLSDRHCLRHTGSRIAARRGKGAAANAAGCANVSGRAYSREDIERTGALDLAEALRRLDASIH